MNFLSFQHFATREHESKPYLSQKREGNLQTFQKLPWERGTYDECQVDTVGNWGFPRKESCVSCVFGRLIEKHFV
jgi:hypothetical protein